LFDPFLLDQRAHVAQLAARPAQQRTIGIARVAVHVTFEHRQPIFGAAFHPFAHDVPRGVKRQAWFQKARESKWKRRVHFEIVKRFAHRPGSSQRVRRRSTVCTRKVQASATMITTRRIAKTFSASKRLPYDRSSAPNPNSAMKISPLIMPLTARPIPSRKPAIVSGS